MVELEEKASEMEEILVKGVSLPKLQRMYNLNDGVDIEEGTEIHDLGVVGKGGENKRHRAEVEPTLSQTPVAD